MHQAFSLHNPDPGPDSAYSNYKAVKAGKKTIGCAIVCTVVDTLIGTAFGAMGSASKEDIMISQKISEAGMAGWREALPYGNIYSKAQILNAAMKIYIKSPKLLVAAVKTIL